MKPKAILKLVIDLGMTILLILLMSFERIGRSTHEWIGIGIFVLFILHHALNRAWLRNLAKGKYTPLRVFQICAAALVFLCGYTSSGGICGACAGYIEYCYNTGSVYGALGQVAGICGNRYDVLNTQISYSYNIGTISGGGRAIGSIVGECNRSTVTDCYWTSTQACRGYRGTDTNCKKLSDDEMKAYTNKAFVLNDKEPLLNNGYPVLYWEKGLTIEEENS